MNFGCAYTFISTKESEPHFRNDNNMGLDGHNNLVIIFQSIGLFDDSWNEMLFQLDIYWTHTHTCTHADTM